VNVHTKNRKLVERSVGILENAAGVDRQTAEQALRKSGNRVAVALIMLKTGLGKVQSAEKLKRAKGNVRKAIEGK
jgi:N-acetylmuramic acid 6-phosphate etherase